MGGPVAARAAELVAELKAGGLNASTSTRNFKLPGVLVEPLPTYAFLSLDGGPTVTWTLYAIAKGPGDDVAADSLEELVVKASQLVEVETATPGTYKLPSASDPYPAYNLQLTDDIAPPTEE